MSCGANYIVPGADPCGGGGGLVGVLSLNSLQGAINITSSDGSLLVTAPGPTGVDVDITYQQPFIGQWYITDNLPTISGATPILWDIFAPWENPGGCVSNPSLLTGDFTILKQGVYQIDLTIVISGNSATWDPNAAMRAATIEIQREGSFVFYSNTAYVPSGLDHTIQVTCVAILNAGDSFRGYYDGSFITGTPLIVPFDGNIRINTNIVWRYIMEGV